MITDWTWTPLIIDFCYCRIFLPTCMTEQKVFSSSLWGGAWLNRKTNRLCPLDLFPSLLSTVQNIKFLLWLNNDCLTSRSGTKRSRKKHASKRNNQNKELVCIFNRIFFLFFFFCLHKFSQLFMWDIWNGCVHLDCIPHTHLFFPDSGHREPYDNGWLLQKVNSFFLFVRSNWMT